MMRFVAIGAVFGFVVAVLLLSLGGEPPPVAPAPAPVMVVPQVPTDNRLQPSTELRPAELKIRDGRTLVGKHFGAPRLPADAGSH